MRLRHGFAVLFGGFVCLLAQTAHAAPIVIDLGALSDGSFGFSGTLLQANDEALIKFSVDSPTFLSARTTSAAVGFDPVLTLLDGAGGFLLDNDDADAATLDALLESLLSAGSYILAVTQSPNLYEPQFGRFGYAEQACAFPPEASSPGCEVFVGLNGTFAGDLGLAQTAAPEPGTVWLVAIGMGALTRRLRSRRPHHSR
jgi:hypothetical protein